jgi:hypothetical protein
MKQTLLTLLCAVFVATGYASASELNGTLLACGDKVKTASVQFASADEETTQADPTARPEQASKDQASKEQAPEHASKDQADSAAEGSASGEPTALDEARDEARGERAQVDDEAIW